MTNVPNCGINLSHIGTVNEPFVTSIFSQFKKLGYQTNFYYGGYLSWENIGELSKYQGVDRIFLV
jgi:phosphoglycerol transferase MdoB-like AlkP superfamily enzyme